jgi:hypothetical protein
MHPCISYELCFWLPPCLSSTVRRLCDNMLPWNSSVVSQSVNTFCGFYAVFFQIRKLHSLRSWECNGHSSVWIIHLLNIPIEPVVCYLLCVLMPTFFENTYCPFLLTLQIKGQGKGYPVRCQCRLRSRVIALLMHNVGAWGGGGVSAMAWPFYPRERAWFT